jgi:hypothetical protein
MGAYRTILTHFSQRYPRVPEGLGLTAAGKAAGQQRGRAADIAAGMQGAGPGLEQNLEPEKGGAPQPGPPCAIAFDGMLVPFDTLHSLPLLGPLVAQVLHKQEGERVE